MLNNLALKTGFMVFNSTATFAFESVAKKHGENICFSHRDFKSTSSEYESKKYILNTTRNLYGPFTFSVFKNNEVILLSGVLEDSILRTVFSIIQCIKDLVFKKSIVDSTVREEA